MKALPSALLLSAATMIGCSNPAGPPVEKHPPLANPEAIREFVRRSPFPDKQEIVITRVTPDEDVWLFQVSYGPPFDCWLGCTYSWASGLANGEKIGWFQVEDYGEFDTSKIALYQVDQSDENLCSPDFWTSLEHCDDDFFHYAFLRRVARSEVIGRQPLAAAIATLPAFFDGYLAQELIDNTVVRGDCGLLRALAALPHHPDYVPVVQEAQTLLVNCGA
ncbi:MAG: hypothetical protein U0167_15210 [bacterium]